MVTASESAIVRLHTAAGVIVGAGFLIADRQILTCAHVIAEALGLSGASEVQPTGEVRLDLPLVAPNQVLTGRVIAWKPKADMAGLELVELPPAQTQPIPLLVATDLWNHAFRVFGFPSGYDDGVWATGVLRSQTATGAIQFEDVKAAGHRVQPGFSGAPVWDEQLNGVVGMTVAVDVDPAHKTAFMNPANLLIEAWPELVQYSLIVPSLAYLHHQLAWYETARQAASHPNRFNAKIEELKAAIANWEGRVEQQQQRVVDGLDKRRQQIADRDEQQPVQKRVPVVGRSPLGQVAYFKDRQRELELLGQLLAEPSTRLVSVIGHGGMGKTALAGKVLQDLERHHWPHTDQHIPVDGLVYLSTRTAGISLERLFLDCAKMLGEEAEKRLNAVWTNPKLNTEDKVSHLLESLKEGLYVILLDNLEDLLDDQGQLVDQDLCLFFDRGLVVVHGARLLVTSRLAIAFKREDLRFDQQVKLLKGLPVEDGTALLRELDPNGDYGLRDAPDEQLALAVTLVHGVPRALEVLVGILANDPFATLAEVMGQFYQQADVVQSLIEENYKRLDSQARRVIEALAVFKRPMSLLAVDYLLEPFFPGLDVPGILRRLTRTSILTIGRVTKTVVLHPIDQDYAYSQLPEEGEYSRPALERRAADYYIHLRTPSETWKTIHDLEPQVAEFEHRVQAGDYDKACQVLNLLDVDYLFLWGYYVRSVKLRERLLDHLTDPCLQTINLGNMGFAYYSLGKVKEAINFCEKAWCIACEINYPQGQISCLSTLGLAYRTLGQIKRAAEFHQEALKIARTIGDREGEGIQQGYLGRLARDSGEFTQAINLYTQSLTIAREIGHRRWEVIWLGHLGMAHDFQGAFEQAINFFREALVTAREMGDRWEEEHNLGHLGHSHRHLGQITTAIKFQEEALVIAREIGDRLGESFQLDNLGQAYCAKGQIEQGIELLQHALAITQEVGYRVGEAIDFYNLGNAYYKLEHFKQAVNFYEQSLTIYRAIGDKRGESLPLQGLSKVLFNQGELAKAQQHCVEALNLDIIETSYPTALTLGTILLHQHNSMAAETFVDAANRCQVMLARATGSYRPRFILAAALVGQAVCDRSWTDENKRSELLAPALIEYRQALEVCAEPGVVQDTFRDLELIHAVGVEGLEPVFELLQSRLKE